MGKNNSKKQSTKAKSYAMKVFLSWSGEMSKQIAQCLNDWLPKVLQYVKPYFSPDIEKGVRWSNDIATELSETSFGILCVTKENVEAPWLMFEAGALSKSIDSARVAPLLFGLKPSDLKGPILHFQATAIDRSDIQKLVETINAVADDDVQLTESTLTDTFSVWWPKLKPKLSQIAEVAPKTDDIEDDVDPNVAIEEILNLTREQHRLLTSVLRSRDSIDQARTDSIRRTVSFEATGSDVRVREFLETALSLTGIVGFSIRAATSDGFPFTFEYVGGFPLADVLGLAKEKGVRCRLSPRSVSSLD